LHIKVVVGPIKPLEIIQRDWQLVAKGTRMTQEFAAFFKRN
jgi:hypothetical protein